MSHSAGAQRAAALYRGASHPPWLRAAPTLFLLLWSGGFSFAKLGLAHAPPLTLLSLRYGLVLLVLLPLFFALRPPLPRRARDWRHLVIIGLLLQGAYFSLSYVAFEHGESAGEVALIVSLQPILVGLLAPWLAGERVSARRWLGLGLGLVGAGLVIVARSRVELGSLIGVLSAIGALLTITFSTLYEKRFGVHQHPVTANLIQYAVGLAVTLPLAWALESMRVDWSLGLIVALAYLVIASSLVAITLLLAMIRHGEVARVSALFYLVPPMAAVIAWLVLGEDLPLLAWPGMALAALGVAVASRPLARIR